MDEKTRVILLNPQEHRDLVELALRGVSDIETYLAEGAPEVDGYTPDEIAHMKALAERSVDVLRAAIDGYDDEAFKGLHRIKPEE